MKRKFSVKELDTIVTLDDIMKKTAQFPTERNGIQHMLFTTVMKYNKKDASHVTYKDILSYIMRCLKKEEENTSYIFH